MNKRTINYLMDELYSAQEKSLIFGLEKNDFDNKIHFCLLLKPKDFDMVKSLFEYIKNTYNITSKSEYRTTYLCDDTFLCCTDVIYYG